MVEQLEKDAGLALDDGAEVAPDDRGLAFGGVVEVVPDSGNKVRLALAINDTALTSPSSGYGVAARGCASRRRRRSGER